MLQKREQDELQQRGEGVAAAETLRSGGESAARPAEKKDEEQHVSVFWRVFGGTILSIVALAERLTRMSADTLRAMLKSGDAEVRRAAALACAMKEEWAHIPDLIDRLTDDEEFVARTAKAGLKSLTGQDLGPANGAPKDQRKAAAAAWRAWWAKQQKK